MVAARRVGHRARRPGDDALRAPGARGAARARQRRACGRPRRSADVAVRSTAHRGRCRRRVRPAPRARGADARRGSPPGLLSPRRCVLEVVQEPDEVLESHGGPDRPARLWGLALSFGDLERASRLRASTQNPVRPAVQPGRKIATVRRSAGLSVPVALMKLRRGRRRVDPATDTSAGSRSTRTWGRRCSGRAMNCNEEKKKKKKKKNPPPPPPPLSQIIFFHRSGCGRTSIRVVVMNNCRDVIYKRK